MENDSQEKINKDFAALLQRQRKIKGITFQSVEGRQELGLLMANHFEWENSAIHALFYSWEDGNYHEDCRTLVKAFPEYFRDDKFNSIRG